MRVESLESPWCPAYTTAEIERLVADGTLVDDGSGPSRVCRHCETAWPIDTEFWGPKETGALGLDNVCRACRVAERRERYRRDQARKRAQEAAA